MTTRYPDLATARAVFDALRLAGVRCAIDPRSLTVITEKKEGT